MAKFKRFIIALLLPSNVAALIIFGRQVWAAIALHTGYFATPNPTVMSATATLDALQAAEAALPHGGTVEDRNLKTWTTIGTTTEANTSLLGSTPLTTYMFRFQSTIKQTTSAWSATVTFTTPAT